MLRIASLAVVFALLQQKGAVRSVEDSLKAMKVPEGLEVTCWASEPGMVNPTNMDID